MQAGLLVVGKQELLTADSHPFAEGIITVETTLT